MKNDSLNTASTDPIAAPDANRYAVGTLTYTKMGLVVVFLWLLGGNFCFTLMERVMPALLPISLKDHQATNTMIGLIVGSIPMMMNVFMCPVISFRSDRYRSRFGRRIPFLFWATPFVALFLILTGCSDTLGTMFYALIADLIPNVPKWLIILGTISLFSILFQFFNLFVASVYYYLWADVVPAAFLSRFMALFGVVSSAALWVWNYFIFGYAEMHMQAIYVGIGLLYLIVFSLMCWRVREGQYPPPPAQKYGGGIVGSCRTYFTECYSIGYYILFFIGTTLFGMSGCVGVFMVFFARENLQLSLDEYGKILAWGQLLVVVLMIPCGYISDKLHPLRANLLAVSMLFLVALSGYWVIHDKTSFLIFWVVSMVPSTLFSVSNLPMYAALLPKERYGQFCSAQSIINSLGMVGGNAIAGLFIDWVGNYRYVFLWQGLFMGLSLLPMILVYYRWVRYGGAKHYVPPGVDQPSIATVT